MNEPSVARQCLAKIRLGALDGSKGINVQEQEADELAAIFATIVLKVAKRESLKFRS